MTERYCEGERFADLSFTEEAFEDCDFTDCVFVDCSFTKCEPFPIFSPPAAFLRKARGVSPKESLQKCAK